MWLQIAQRNGMCCEPRVGRRVFRGPIHSPVEGLDHPVRMAFEAVEQIIDKNGQLLLVRGISVDVYLTTDAAPLSSACIMHAEPWSCHSEINRDLDVERLPFAKSVTNDLILHFTLLA
jgi:hypothetical protein